MSMSSRKAATKARTRVLPPGHYALKDVCRLFDVKPAQVEYWVRTGVVRPQLPSAGRGEYRNFSFANLIEIELCRVLTATGVSVSDLRSMTEFGLRFWDPEDSYIEGPEQRAVFDNNRRDRVARFGEAHVLSEESNVRKWTTEREAQFDRDYPGSSDRLAEEEALWRRFKSSEARGALRYYLLRTFKRLGVLYWMCVKESDLLAAINLEEDAVLVNLKPVFERVEAATGDRWRTWKELTNSAL